MKRNKYLNTFETTADYDTYIDSAYPEFPNVGLTKDDDKLHYMRTSPNDHLIYGELVDPSLTPVFEVDSYWTTKKKSITSTTDSVNNTYYIDNITAFGSRYEYLANFIKTNASNVISIKKLRLNAPSSLISLQSMFSECTSLTSINLDTNIFNNVTNISNMFSGCTSLIKLSLVDCDLSNVTNQDSTFSKCNALTDVYITVEATLMKLTNNLSSQGVKYIPANNGNCTIHYNDVDYKWQNNKWTPQS